MRLIGMNPDIGIPQWNRLAVGPQKAHPGEIIRFEASPTFKVPFGHQKRVVEPGINYKGEPRRCGDQIGMAPWSDAGPNN